MSHHGPCRQDKAWERYDAIAYEKTKPPKPSPAPRPRSQTAILSAGWSERPAPSVRERTGVHHPVYDNPMHSPPSPKSPKSPKRRFTKSPDDDRDYNELGDKLFGNNGGAARDILANKAKQVKCLLE